MLHLSMLLPKKYLLPPSIWPRRKYNWALILKKSLLIHSESSQDIVYTHRQSRKRMVNTLFTYCNGFSIMPSFLRHSLEVNIHTFYSFLFCVIKRIRSLVCNSPGTREYFGVKSTTFLLNN